MENEISGSDDPVDQYDSEPVLTVTTVSINSQTFCGRENIFARFLCKYNVDLYDDDNYDTNLEVLSNIPCTKAHWVPNDCGNGKFWVSDDVIGDGNCFFRSLSKALTCVEQFHPLLRFVTVDHMRNHKDLYQCLIDGDVDAHLQHMLSTTGSLWSWATEAEVKAAADIMGCDIYIRQQVGHKVCWCRFQPDKIFRQFEDYFLTIIYQNHHFLLGRMVNHGCNCQLSRNDVDNTGYDVIESSNNINTYKPYDYIILWNKTNRNIKCKWSDLLKNDDALKLYMTITLHLPSSMTSYPLTTLLFLFTKVKFTLSTKYIRG